MFKLISSALFVVPVLSLAAVLSAGTRLSAAMPVASSASAAPHASGAKVCMLEISGNDVMQYDKKELRVGADCARVKLTLKHIGKLPANVMGHTWVLAKTADMAAIVTAGLAAGPAHNYVPPGDKRVIAATSIVGGGQSTSVTFATSGMKKGGDYMFFCSFPGHNVLMKGKFIFG